MFKKMAVTTILPALLIAFPGYAGSKLSNRIATSRATNTLKYDEYKFGKDDADQESRFTPIKLGSSAKIKGLDKDQFPYGMVGSTHSKNYLEEKAADGRLRFHPVSETMPSQSTENLNMVAAQAGYKGGGYFKEKEANGAIVAICDGNVSGSAAATTKHKKAIYDFAQKACSEAANKIGRFTDPAVLAKALPGIVKEIKAMPGAKNINLTLGKAFLLSDNSYRYVGVNLGSSGVIGVQNGKRGVEISTVSPPIPEIGGIFSNSKNLVPIFEKRLNAGTMLVGLSFGAYESLGFTDTLNPMEGRREREIGGAKIASKLKGDTLTPDKIVKTIRDVAVENLQSLRNDRVSQINSALGVSGSPCVKGQNCKNTATTDTPENALLANEKQIQAFETKTRKSQDRTKAFEARVNEDQNRRNSLRAVRDFGEQGSDFAAVGIMLP